MENEEFFFLVVCLEEERAVEIDAEGAVVDLRDTDHDE